jgi:sugar/nucleoside kinase (ribokinase family)
MTKICDVVAMGNAIVDVLAPVEDEFLATHGIVKGVMTLIDEARAKQLYDVLPGMRREIAGGSAANTMAALASLGGNGHYIGKVRDDRLGHAFASGMKELDIGFTATPATEGPATACCMIAVAEDGQRSMNTYLGACRGLTPDDIREEEISVAKILYIEGYLWDMDAAKDASRKAIAIAKKSGVKIAFTLSDPFCVGRFREEFLELLDNDLDIVFANEDEAKALFSTKDFDSALRNFSDWNGTAAITRSEKGCTVVGRDFVKSVPAYPIENVVDTTGAGDAFAAGFLYGMTHGKALDDCGRLGALAAGEVISHFGARPAAVLRDLAAAAKLI